MNFNQICKMCLMIILKVTKNQSFTLSLEDTSFEKAAESSPTLRSDKICDHWKQFQNDAKCFLFHLKKLFSYSKDFNFCLEFSVMQKIGMIKNIKLISKIMTSQPGKQTITIHILSSILRKKGDQSMKFG